MITEKTHVRLTLITLVSGLAFAAGVVWGAAVWKSNIETRVESVERQTREQWKRIGENTAIGEKVSRIDERTATIMDIMKEMQR